MNKTEWAILAKSLLKAELKRHNCTYQTLVHKLKLIGINESVENINNKINRGTFSAVFFFQCMKALKVKEVNFQFEANGSSLHE